MYSFFAVNSFFDYLNVFTSGSYTKPLMYFGPSFSGLHRLRHATHIIWIPQHWFQADFILFLLGRWHWCHLQFVCLIIYDVVNVVPGYCHWMVGWCHLWFVCLIIYDAVNVVLGYCHWVVDSQNYTSMNKIRRRQRRRQWQWQQTVKPPSVIECTTATMSLKTARSRVSPEMPEMNDCCGSGNANATKRLLIAFVVLISLSLPKASPTLSAISYSKVQALL